MSVSSPILNYLLNDPSTRCNGQIVARNAATPIHTPCFILIMATAFRLDISHLITKTKGTQRWSNPPPNLSIHCFRCDVSLSFMFINLNYAFVRIQENRNSDHNGVSTFFPNPIKKDHIHGQT